MGYLYLGKQIVAGAEGESKWLCFETGTLDCRGVELLPPDIIRIPSTT